jgi:hypothetical protein
MYIATSTGLYASEVQEGEYLIKVAGRLHCIQRLLTPDLACPFVLYWVLHRLLLQKLSNFVGDIA